MITSKRWNKTVFKELAGYNTGRELFISCLISFFNAIIIDDIQVVLTSVEKFLIRMISCKKKDYGIRVISRKNKGNTLKEM